MSGILYIAAFLCFGLFFIIGNQIMSLTTILKSTNMFYEYIGYMSIGLGIFSSSVLTYLAKNTKI